MFKKIFNLYKNFVLSRLLRKLKSLGDNIDISNDVVLSCPERIIIGSNVYIGPKAEINGLGGIVISDGVIIGPNLIVHSVNHRFRNAVSIPYDNKFEFKKVHINENVWIGGNVIIVPGAEIGEGAIIGAGSVVSGKIPPLAIAVGNPIKVIKYRDSEHYFNLKKDNQIYLKLKKEKLFKPDLYSGYENE